ncbi:23798_t:CDS:2, partial [Dentiscutata erythropus]
FLNGKAFLAQLAERLPSTTSWSAEASTYNNIFKTTFMINESQSKGHKIVVCIVRTKHDAEIIFLAFHVTGQERFFRAPDTHAEICVKMDQILLEYLSLISALQEQWKQISTNLGSVTHAKYTMGPHRLNQNQYDGRMQATARVLISQKKDINMLNTPNEFICQYTLTSLEGIADSQEDNDSPSLRRRVIKNPENDLTKKRSQSRSEDPLRWFGILVPSSLRESQRHFKQSLSGMINIINLRNEIINKEAEYQMLKKEKEKFMEENRVKHTSSVEN